MGARSHDVEHVRSDVVERGLTVRADGEGFVAGTAFALFPFDDGDVDQDTVDIVDRRRAFVEGCGQVIEVAEKVGDGGLDRGKWLVRERPEFVDPRLKFGLFAKTLHRKGKKRILVGPTGEQVRRKARQDARLLFQRFGCLNGRKLFIDRLVETLAHVTERRNGKCADSDDHDQESDKACKKSASHT